MTIYPIGDNEMQCIYANRHINNVCPPDRNRHEQVSLNGICIDKGLSELMPLLWSMGMKTKASCELEKYGKNRAYIFFERAWMARVFTLLFLLSSKHDGIILETEHHIGKKATGTVRFNRHGIPDMVAYIKRIPLLKK